MCGLAGSIAYPLDVPAVLEALKHRGPDDAGDFSDGAVQLLHTRLAIVDATGGSQPMQRGEWVIAFNGEIYNHEALRASQGLNCQTHSDTETLLELFAKLGPPCLELLDGMFAFALYNTRSQTLFLARDRAGEKPLYLWQSAGQTVFASELNALRAALPLQVDDAAVRQFLASGVFTQHNTAYQNVTEVLPGQLVTIDCSTQKQTVASWFSLESHYLHGAVASTNEPLITDVEQAIKELDEKLNSSVVNCLLSSDLEVGCFLSGGIDSGLVTAMASEHVRSLRTFTVSFDGQFDESTLAASVAKRYNTKHCKLPISFDSLEQDIETIVLNYGEPIADDSIIPTWYVCQAAKQHVSVVLTGDGADEQFAGYRRYVPYAKLPLFTAGTAGIFGMQALHAMLPKVSKQTGVYQHLHRLVAMMGQSGSERYIVATTTANQLDLIPENSQNESQLHMLYAHIAQLPLTHLQRLMLMDAQVLLPGALLPKMDIGSMSHSLETRSPFLGKQLLEFAPRLHDSLKIRNGQTKYLLRTLAKRYLPEDVVSAPKRGFGTPLVQWMATHLRAPVHDRLQPSNALVRTFCEPAALDNLLDGSAAMSKAHQAKLLWMLYTTELWLQKEASSSTAVTAAK